VVIILADDMGYGDPQCYNADSKCVTPNIDRLAKGGMMFTDAHTAGSVCVPSRYGLMTGQYPFRVNLNWRKSSVVDSSRRTIAKMLSHQGYETSMVGKWHLGFDNGPDYDYEKPLTGGPADRGFDHFFGMHASLDIPPYFFLNGRQPTKAPTETIADNNSPGWSPIQGAFWRKGNIGPDFKHEEVLDRFATEATSYLSTKSKESEPFFLYVALPAPHTPWLPAKKFRGIGGAGMYSEFVAHVDDVVGRIVNQLDEQKLTEDTLVLFSSDNGPVWYDADEAKYGHHSCGPFRGMKGDSWEGGHRVPFIVRWPGIVEPSSRCDHLIGFVDLFATLTEITEAKMAIQEAEDSVSFLDSLKGNNSSARKTMVHHHAATVVRDGKWKLITHLGSGGFSKPRREQPQPNGPRGQLYNLADDPGETKNLWSDQPERVQKMEALLKSIREESELDR